MEKLNIAEILKDCPKGTKLYSPLCGECKLYAVMHGIIYINTNSNKLRSFYSDGRYIQEQDGECVLFPSKENRDWDKFNLFKDGDIITCTNSSCTFVAIYNCMNKENSFYRHACLILDGRMHFSPDNVCSDFTYPRFATEEEKQKLFDAIKANGYKWNAETKTLEKLVEPKFKVGNRIRHKTHIRQENAVTEIKDTHYILDDELALPFTSQDDYELVPNKFDITTLNPCDKVLARNNSLKKWRIHFFERYNKRYGAKYPFICMFGCEYSQCIPYKGNEHLLNTANDCDEYYKTWA